MITEDYCSYEVSKLLKEKGFDESCKAYYEDGKFCWVWNNGCSRNTDNPNYVSCPTHQMAMKWLRKRHIIIVIVPAYFNGEQCASWDIDIWVDGNYKHPFEDYPTYEQAVDAALKFCLTEIL